MRWECRERFPRHRLQKKPLVSNPGMHHGTCVTHVPWCMSGSLTHSCGENVPGIFGACATRNLTYLARGPWKINILIPRYMAYITHYNDVMMSALASQITSLTIVYSTVYSRRRSKKTSKIRVNGHCEGNSPMTDEFPVQRASNAENISIW